MSQTNKEEAIRLQKEKALQMVLSSEARYRLENIRLGRPEFASDLENQLFRLIQSGGYRGELPIPDDKFKEILKAINDRSNSRKVNIRYR